MVKVTLGLTGYFKTLRRIFEKRGPLKWLAFAACLVVFGFGAFTASLEDADRYAELREADWIPTNMWLKSAECARLQGVWLAICDGNNLARIAVAVELSLWKGVCDRQAAIIWRCAP